MLTSNTPEFINAEKYSKGKKNGRKMNSKSNKKTRSIKKSPRGKSR